MNPNPPEVVTQGEGPVEVLPCDRDAAADLRLARLVKNHGHQPWIAAVCADIRAGRHDDWCEVQALARHRLRHTPDREAMARKLCEQHGGDPDAVASEPHDCWDGPLWTAFLTDADAIIALIEGGGAL